MMLNMISDQSLLVLWYTVYRYLIREIQQIPYFIEQNLLVEKISEILKGKSSLEKRC